MKNENSVDKPISPNDHLANERTFLAWIRTSIAIMGFGFVVVKFSLFTKQLSLALGTQIVINGKSYSTMIGISLVMIGAIVTILSFLRYKSIEKSLLNNTYYPSSVLSLLSALAILIISVLLIIYLLPSI